MDPLDAFLIVSAIAYYAAVLSLKKYVINMPLIVEKVSMAIVGTALIIAVLYDVFVIWLVLGIASTASTVLTFAGYTKWYIAYKDGPSEAAQMFMAGWDLLIALCCIIKAF